MLKNGYIHYKKAPRGKVYEQLNAKENAYESDTTISQRMRDMFFNYHGNWKKRLPLYGITDARGVEVGTETTIKISSTDLNFSFNLQK